MEATVPSRIVLMGTSKVSLNERFSHVPIAPKMVIGRHNITSLGKAYSNGSVTTTTATAGATEQIYREPIMSRRPVYIDEYEDDLIPVDDDGDMESTTGYIEQVRVVPRSKSVLYQSAPARFSRVPIRNRITFPSWRSKFNTVFVRKSNMNDRPRPFGSLRYASRNTHFVRNGFVSNNYGSNASWRSRNRSFRGRRGAGGVGSGGGGGAAAGGGGGRGRGLSNARNTRANITREELDQELEEYMKKGKHPQIDVSDLK